MTPAVLKHALIGLDSYDFMKDTLEDVDSTIKTVGATKRKSSQEDQKKNKSENKDMSKDYFLD